MSFGHARTYFFFWLVHTWGFIFVFFNRMQLCNANMIFTQSMPLVGVSSVVILVTLWFNGIWSVRVREKAASLLSAYLWCQVSTRLRCELQHSSVFPCWWQKPKQLSHHCFLSRCFSNRMVSINSQRWELDPWTQLLVTDLFTQVLSDKVNRFSRLWNL